MVYSCSLIPAHNPFSYYIVIIKIILGMKAVHTCEWQNNLWKWWLLWLRANLGVDIWRIQLHNGTVVHSNLSILLLDINSVHWPVLQWVLKKIIQPNKWNGKNKRRLFVNAVDPLFRWQFSEITFTLPKLSIRHLA